MDIQLNIDDKSLKLGFKDFKHMNPIAVRNTLNTVAALSRRNAVKEVKNNFTLRNNMTVKNIQFQQATGNKIKKMKSRIGATKKADYMERQEFGGRRKSKGKNTSIAQAGARRGVSAVKPVTKSLYMSKISRRMVKGPGTTRIKSRKARSVSRMYVGHKKKKFVMRGRNIFRVDNIWIGRGSVRVKLTHIYTIENKPIRVRPSPWLRPAIKKPSRDLQNIYKSNLQKLWKSGPETL